MTTTPSRAPATAPRATASALPEDLREHAENLLSPTALDLDTALTVAAGAPAPEGTDPATITALRTGWAATPGEPR